MIGSPPLVRTRRAGSERDFRLEALVVVAIAVVVGGALAVLLRQDLNYDQMAYHRYGAWAVLHHRLAIDRAWGHQTLLSQIWNVPFLLAIEHLPPRLAAALIGGFQGLNLALVYGITRSVRRPDGEVAPRAACAAMAIVGFFSAVALSEVGTTYVDITLSVPILAGIWVAVVACGRRSPRALVLAGALVGAAAGWKLTNFSYGVGLVALVAIAATGDAKERLRWSGIVLVGLVIGFGIGGGWWSWRLWSMFRNPVAPFYNSVFRSPWFPVSNWRDPRFVPRRVDLLVYPFRWATGRSNDQEIVFRDPRWLIILALAAAAVRVTWRRRATTSTEAAGSAAAGAVWSGLLAFAAVSYLCWFTLLGYHRYLVPLEMLTGAIGWGLLTVVVPRVRTRQLAAAVLAVIALAATRPGSWGRVPWTSSWWGIRLPALAHEQRALLVQAGGRPVAYLVPDMPGSDRFVQLEFRPGQNRSADSFRSLVAGFPGPILFLQSAGYDADLLRRFGLTFDPGTCQPVHTRDVYPIAICRAFRIS